MFVYNFGDVKFTISVEETIRCAYDRSDEAKDQVIQESERLETSLNRVSSLLQELAIPMDPRSFVKLRDTIGSSTVAVSSFITEGEVPSINTVTEYNKLPNKVIMEKGNALDDACTSVNNARKALKAAKVEVEQWERFARAAKIQTDPFFFTWDQLNKLKF